MTLPLGPYEFVVVWLSTWGLSFFWLVEVSGGFGSGPRRLHLGRWLRVAPFVATAAAFAVDVVAGLLS